MALPWSRLAPHRPLLPGDALHVPRPQGSAAELATRLIQGVSDIVAVVGPVGSGKSTELAQAAAILGSHMVVVWVQLDRLLDMRSVTEEAVFDQIARHIAAVTRERLHIEFSKDLQRQLHPEAPTLFDLAIEQALPARDLLLSVMREVTERSPQGSLALLLDGLEKSDTGAATRVVRALLEVRDEARLVFVAPYSVVVGSGGHDLQASGAYYHFIRAVPVRGDQGPEAFAGRAFLSRIAGARLGMLDIPLSLGRVLDQAATISGGLPRSFLQLVQAAGSYAALNARELPEIMDLGAAARDQSESLGRLLEKGDVELLGQADGKSDREIPQAERVRLLMQGLLLEYKTSAGTVVRPAPLLQDLLAGKAA